MAESEVTCLGCFSETKRATEEVQKISDRARRQVEQQLGKADLQKFVAIEYRFAIAAGTDYLVKIQVFDTERGYMHVRMFQALPCNGGNVDVFKVLPYMTRDDALEIF